MTVQTINNKVILASDGTIVDFNFDFKTDDISSIFVYDNGILTTINYTVTLNADQDTTAGGSIKYDTPPAVGDVTIQRVEDGLQLTKYPLNGKFPSSSHEAALDKLAKVDQQQQEQIDRTVLAPINDDGTTSFSFPPYAANKGIVWDDVNKKLVNSVDDFNDAAASSAASAAAALVSENNALVSENNTAASFLSFDQRYLGAYTADPTIDNQGGVLIVGAIYWNSTNDVFRVWNSTLAWENSPKLIGINDQATAPVLTLADTRLDSTVPIYVNGVSLSPEIKWTFPTEIGTSAILTNTNASIDVMTSNTIILADSNNDELRAYEFGGDVWSLIGAGFAIPMIDPSVVSLNSTDIAFLDESTNSLRTYGFNGTNWFQIGNGLTMVVTNVSLARLSSTDICVANDNNNDITTYRFDGTNWSKIGNSLAIASMSNPEITGINGTDIAHIHTSTRNLGYFRFDGTNWAQVGVDLNIAGAGQAAMSRLNNTDISFVDSSNDILSVYRFDGNTYNKVGNHLKLPVGSNVGSISAFNGTDIALIDGQLSKLTAYRFGFSI